MAEIDSLEISIQNNIDKVNKNMDLLIQKMGIVAKGISAIGSNKGLEEFTKKAQSISSDMGKIGKSVSQSVKPIEEQAGKIAKTFEQVKEPFKDLGKGFKISGGIADIQKSLQRYENELEKAKLKEQELSIKGMTDTKGYRDSVVDIAKYENVIESLKKQLESINKIQATAKIRIDGRESAERYLVEFKKELMDFRAGIKSMGEVYGGLENVPKGGLDTPIENMTSSLAELKSAYPQAINLISAFEEELKNLQTVSSNLTKEPIRVKVDEEPIKNATQSIREKMESLSELFKDSGKDFVFSGNTEQLDKQIQKVSAELDALFSRQDKMIELGKVNTEPFKNLIRDIENARNRLEILESSRPEALNRTLQENADKAKALRMQLTQLKIPEIKENNLTKLNSALDKAKGKMASLKADLANKFSTGKITANVDDSGYRKLREQIALTGKTINALQDKIKVASQQTRQSSVDMAASFESNLKNLKIPPIDETNLKKLQSALKKTEENLEKLRLKLANGLTMGKITANVDDSGYRNLREQIALTEKQAEALRKKIGNIGVFERLKQSMSGASSSSKKLQKAFSGLYATLKKIEKGIMSVLSKIGKLIKSMFSLGTATKKSNGGFNIGLKTILKYGFGIRSLYALVNKLRRAIKEGMENLIQYSNQTNQSVSMLSSSMSQFKNASAAAFAPILNAIAPVLNQLIQLFIRATNAVNQFFSALTGHGTWIKAKYNFEDVADKISDASDAAKGALQPFDKLNNLTTQKGAGGVNPEDMFETVPVEDKFKKLADKIKDIMSKLFAPLKEAWRREGKFVMDSWKYALDEVWKLIKDIGRDFLTVWQQEKTIKIFEDILHIIGDIGLAIGHLARNFREAWNENETGLHILENIRDIIGVIIHNIRLAADFTVEWADKLNFSPILQAIERFTKSLIPVADALSGVLMDFYTMVLLPLGKWTIEKGLPELLDVFTAFNEKVDWKKLRDNLDEFWKHLEPFAETVGEGLIIFIERVSDLVANFINSETFVNFLHAVEDWMDSVTPEDVADGIEKLAKALIGLKLAFLGFQAISALTGVLTTIKTFLSFFGVGGSGATVAKGIGETTTAIGGLKSALADFGIATAGATIAGNLMIDATLELAKANGVSAQAIKNAEKEYGNLTGPWKLVKDGLEGLTIGLQGLPTTIAGSVGSVDALNKAMEAIAKGTIYTDEQIKKMQETWKFSTDDIEMLRQEMLDANPQLREFADNFGLFDTSAETLQEIYYGFQDISNGIYGAENASSFLYGRFGELTEESKAFFDDLATGKISIEDFKASAENAGTSIEDLGNKMTEAGQNISTGLSEGISGEEFTNSAQSLIENAKLIVIPSAKASGAEIGENLGEGLAQGISEKTESITSSANQIANLAIKTIKEVTGVHSPSTVFAEIGKNLMLGLSNGINQNSSGVLQRLSDFASKLKNPFSGISESFVSVGRNLMSGLKNGISSMASSVYNKISEIGNGIAGKMRKVLDIHSPSRVMFELGDFTMQGFQNGLESLYQPIISSVKSFGSDLTVAPAMGIDRSYMDYGQISSYMPNYQTQDYYRSNQTAQGDSELKALLRENNKLLQAILEKPIIDDDMSFQSSRRGYQAEKNRQFGKSGTTLPVWG